MARVNALQNAMVLERDQVAAYEDSEASRSRRSVSKSTNSCDSRSSRILICLPAAFIFLGFERRHHRVGDALNDGLDLFRRGGGRRRAERTGVGGDVIMPGCSGRSQSWHSFMSVRMSGKPMRCLMASRSVVFSAGMKDSGAPSGRPASASSSTCPHFRVPFRVRRAVRPAHDSVVGQQHRVMGLTKGSTVSANFCVPGVS